MGDCEKDLDSKSPQEEEEKKKEEIKFPSSSHHASDHDDPIETLTRDLQNVSLQGNKPYAYDDPTTATMETLDGVEELKQNNLGIEGGNETHKEKASSNHHTIETLGGDVVVELQQNNIGIEEDNENQKDEPQGETVKLRIFQYPLRPEEPDCAFYLRTGSCRYGFHCKFNHPRKKKHQVRSASHLPESADQKVELIPAIEAVKEKEGEKEEQEYPGPERSGQIECKYYRTTGGCKFGKACRYYHPREKTVLGSPTEFNFLGLPIRPGEKKCPFFMRTGSCKFATSCRFHHPDPIDAGESDPLSGYHDGESEQLHSDGSFKPPVTSWSLPGTYNETAPYMDTSPLYPTVVVSPSQVHQNQEWNGYQVPVRYSPERNDNPQLASVMNDSCRKANNSMHHHQPMMVGEFPQRPGQHECQYYMKHGDCKYRLSCRFHHPKNRLINSPVLSSIGLPLRPDQIICSNYSRFGICKYGPSCKYDHPA